MDPPITKDMRVLVELGKRYGWDGDELVSNDCSFELTQNMSSGASEMDVEITTKGGTKLIVKWRETNGLSSDSLMESYIDQFDIDSEEDHYGTDHYNAWEAAHVDAVHDDNETDFLMAPTHFMLEALRDWPDYGRKARVQVKALGDDIVDRIVDDEDVDEADEEALDFSLAVMDLLASEDASSDEEEED